MYAKLEITRQIFRFWKWQLVKADIIFIGPFQSSQQCDKIMSNVSLSLGRFLSSQRYALIDWQRMNVLPEGKKAIELEDAALNITLALVDSTLLD